MAITDHETELDRRLRGFVRRDFKPRYGKLEKTFPTNPVWRRLSTLGSRLWLDTGDAEAIATLWTREFEALTTNNTLLNREVQKGTYDDLIAEAAELLDEFDLSEEQRKLELAFVLNARHGLRLVEQFDARVSVEEHTDLAHDAKGALEYARRFYAICPERFYVKIPFTPAGLLATRAARNEGIPVNHTLGFAARQNYVIARLAYPSFVNVFMGRLNAFVTENGLGDGDYVGERAVIASQCVINECRAAAGRDVQQIAASYREGQQVRDLAGVDVLTIPPKVAQEFLDFDLDPAELTDRTGESYIPALNENVDPQEVGLSALWDVGDDVKSATKELEERGMEGMRADDLVDFYHEHGCAAMFPRWTDEEHATSAQEGKIPSLENWSEDLASGRVGLDALMNLAGYHCFAADQAQMDAHVRQVLGQ